MEDTIRRKNTGVCPHIDHNDHRCGSRFSLGRIEQAFGVCFDTFHVCPMYHQLNQELAEARVDSGSADDPMTPLITLTSHGSEVPLRATGT